MRGQNCEKQLLVSPCLPSVRPSAGNNWDPTERIFMKFDVYFSKICRENSSFVKNLTRIAGTLHEGVFLHLRYTTLFSSVYFNL